MLPPDAERPLLVCRWPVVARDRPDRVAVVYWVEPANSLPELLPGAPGRVEHHHVKHGIAAFLVGLACFALRLVPSGPEARTPPT